MSVSLGRRVLSHYSVGIHGQPQFFPLHVTLGSGSLRATLIANSHTPTPTGRKLPARSSHSGLQPVSPGQDSEWPLGAHPGSEPPKGLPRSQPPLGYGDFNLIPHWEEPRTGPYEVERNGNSERFPTFCPHLFRFLILLSLDYSALLAAGITMSPF